MNRTIKIIVLILLGSTTSFSFINTELTSREISGTYSVEAYPESDGLNWEVKLKINGKGYQKSFYDGCSQSELKFKWQLSNEDLTFSQTLTRERFSCKEKWSEWNSEFFNDEDPFTIEVLNDNEFILTSQVQDYQEKWTKTK